MDSLIYKPPTLSGLFVFPINLGLGCITARIQNSDGEKVFYNLNNDNQIEK
jgi:hypothetical protein